MYVYIIQLSIDLLNYLSLYLSIYLSICLSFYLSIYLSIYYLFIHLLTTTTAISWVAMGPHFGIDPGMMHGEFGLSGWCVQWNYGKLENYDWTD